MQSMIFFEFGDIFRCNGSKVENKSVIGILSKDITEDLRNWQTELIQKKCLNRHL